MRLTILVGIAVTLAGCSNPVEVLEEQTKPTGSIISRKTQNIEKFDPATPNQTVVDHTTVKVADDPVSVATGTYALDAYGPLAAQAGLIPVQQAMAMWKIENNNRAPSYEQFMEQIIKANGISLPVLPGDHRYAYDESKGEVIVVNRPGIGPEGGVGPDNRKPQPAAPAVPDPTASY